jgi:hypothetical protein
MRYSLNVLLAALLALVLGVCPLAAQTEYQPKFAGDPARSDAEASALGYMRTVLRAQREYKKKHNTYATSLANLVGTGSFTRRMIKTDRGEYQVGFKSEKNGFILVLTPQQVDAQHRAFFSDETGTIRAEEDKPASESSLPVSRG